MLNTVEYKQVAINCHLGVSRNCSDKGLTETLG
jgi:hypothetical protein